MTFVLICWALLAGDWFFRVKTTKRDWDQSQRLVNAVTAAYVRRER